MKTAPLLLFVLLSCISLSQCKDLVVGKVSHGRLIWKQKVKYIGIPLVKRVKQIFFSDPGQQIIRGVVARDLDNSEAEASLTAGGVGFSFVNIKLKSTRGSGLNYKLEVYV